MLKFSLLVILLFASILPAQEIFAKDNSPNQKQPVAQKNLEINRLKITGMSCGSCAAAVKVTLKRLKGIVNAEVSFKDKIALVHFDPTKVTVAQIIMAIEKEGYGATLVK